MCNRFRQTKSGRELAERFQAWDEIEDTSRFNIAPTQPILTVRAQAGKRMISSMRWGLVRSSAARSSSGHFNARSESVSTTSAFRDLLPGHRCLIPADGFYEWRTLGSVKQPFCFELANRELFAFAGLWEEGGTCVILTIEANSLVADIHDRMPVIVSPENYDVWLNSPDLKAALGILKPYDPKLMRSHPVNKKLNDSRNDSSESAAAVSFELPVQGQLF
jgi:putative SOS response-associated peptidase YedK